MSMPSGSTVQLVWTVYCCCSCTWSRHTATAAIISYLAPQSSASDLLSVVDFNLSSIFSSLSHSPGQSHDDVWTNPVNAYLNSRGRPVTLHMQLLQLKFCQCTALAAAFYLRCACAGCLPSFDGTLLPLLLLPLEVYLHFFSLLRDA